MIIRFNPKVVIQEHDNLTDDYIETCISFDANQETMEKKDITFRFPVTADQLENINVTLIGTKLGCGRNMFVIPLTKPQTVLWTGIWRTCSLFEKFEIEGKESCTFHCPCLGGCEEIQVTRRPRTMKGTTFFAFNHELLK